MHQYYNNNDLKSYFIFYGIKNIYLFVLSAVVKVRDITTIARQQDDKDVQNIRMKSNSTLHFHRGRQVSICV